MPHYNAVDVVTQMILFCTVFTSSSPCILQFVVFVGEDGWIPAACAYKNMVPYHIYDNAVSSFSATACPPHPPQSEFLVPPSLGEMWGSLLLIQSTLHTVDTIECGFNQNKKHDPALAELI